MLGYCLFFVKSVSVGTGVVSAGWMVFVGIVLFFCLEEIVLGSKTKVLMVCGDLDIARVVKRWEYLVILMATFGIFYKK